MILFNLFTSKQNFSFYCNLNIIFIIILRWLLRKPFLFIENSHFGRRATEAIPARLFVIRILFLKCFSFSKINHIHVFDRNTCFCCPHIFIIFLTRKSFFFIHFPGDALNFDIFLHFKRSSTTQWRSFQKDFTFVSPKSHFDIVLVGSKTIPTQTRIFSIHCFDF